MARVIAGASEPGNNRLMIVAALAFAVIAAALVYAALGDGGGGDSGAGAIAMQDVVVAARGAEVNTLLTLDMLEVRSVAADQVLSGAAASPEALVGLPVRFPIQAGEQITSTKVGVDPVQDSKDIALIIKPGMRAFSVAATEVTAVGGLILAENHVDVIAVYGEDENGVVRSSTVLQDIEVLSVAQEAQEPVPAMAAQDAEASTGELGQGVRGQRPEELERQPGARSVTLAVTPEQAQMLAALQARGDVQIWLSLRPFDDTAAVPLQQTELSSGFPPAVAE